MNRIKNIYRIFKKKLVEIKYFGIIFVFKKTYFLLFYQISKVLKIKSQILNSYHKTMVRKLDKLFGDSLLSFINDYETTENSMDSNTEKIIWNYWYQGNHEDIEILSVCLNQLHKNVDAETKIITITKDTISNYISLPSEVIEKYENKLIDHAQFSDILRTGLIAIHGGMWLDIDCYVDGDISKYLENGFWSIKSLKKEYLRLRGAGLVAH